VPLRVARADHPAHGVSDEHTREAGIALLRTGDHGVEVVDHELVVGDEDALSSRPAMAYVVGPGDHGPAPDQDVGRVLIAAEMLPIPMSQDRDVAGVRAGPDVHRDRLLTAGEPLHFCVCGQGDAPG
jgi:hypothetical protein